MTWRDLITQVPRGDAVGLQGHPISCSPPAPGSTPNSSAGIAPPPAESPGLPASRPPETGIRPESVHRGASHAQKDVKMWSLNV